MGKPRRGSIQPPKRRVGIYENFSTLYPTLPVKLDCDASSMGIGVVLSHQMKDGTKRPIAFASRSLTKAERNYSEIEREALQVKLDCDASSVGIGAILSHQMKDGTERPNAFASRSLTKAERNYLQIEQEAMSIVGV